MLVELEERVKVSGLEQFPAFNRWNERSSVAAAPLASVHVYVLFE